MKIEDLKFRYIIPLEEKDERGEWGFLYDKERLGENSEDGGLTYTDFMCGEALVMERAKGEKGIVFLNDLAIDGFTFPTDVTDTEKGVALFVVKFRSNGNEETIQRGIDAYFADKKIEKAEGLQKHFGYPY